MVAKYLIRLFALACRVIVLTSVICITHIRGFGNCPDTILFIQVEPEVFTFQIPGAENASDIEWNFGDSITITDDLETEHEFAPGIYTVVATLMDPDCPWDGPFTLSVVVEVYSCAIELGVTEGDDGYFTFIAIGNPEVYPMTWDFGDGVSFDATWAVDHIFEPGTYDVCAYVVSEWCPDTVSTCVTITYGSQVCTDVLIYFFSDVPNGGPTQATWNIEDYEGNPITEGVANFNDVVDVFEQIVCLPDDCYYFEYCANDIMWGPNDFTFSITSEEEIVTNLGFSTVTPCGQIDLFSVNGECEDEFLCNAEFFALPDPTFPGYFSFLSQNGTTDIEITWDFGNGTTSNEFSPLIQFTENGMYEVCCTVVYEDCTDTWCDSVEVQGLGEDCFDIAIEILGYYSAPGPSDELEIFVYTQDGLVDSFETIMHNGMMYLPIYLCLDDSCFEFEIHDADSVLDAGYLSLECNWLDGANQLGVWSIGSDFEIWTIQSGTSENCWTLEIGNRNEVDWNIFPNPANEYFEISGLKSVEQFEILILDITGNVVISQKTRAGQRINTSMLSPGLYIVRCGVPGISNSKLLISR